MYLRIMARHRIITLLGLTSLVATMVTITRYSTSFTVPTGRLSLTQQKLYEYQQKLRLIASEQNSNETYNHLLDKIISTQTRLQSEPELDSVSSDTNNNVLIKDQQQEGPTISVSSTSASSSSIVPVAVVSSSISLQVSSSSSSSQPSVKLIESFSNNVNNKIPIEVSPFVPPLVQVINSNDINTSINNVDSKTPGSSSKTPITEKPVAPPNKQIDSDNKSYSKLISDIKVDNKAIDPNIITKRESQVIINNNIDVDQKPAKNGDNSDSNQKLQQLDSLENNENKLSKMSFKPKLVFDSEDLKTTESMRIDKPLGCDEDSGASLDLLVIVNSAVDHQEARAAIRMTWGQFAVERGAYLLFLIGSTTNETLQQLVVAEDKIHSDILQGQFIDNYFNLTLKTISLMKWITDKCSKVKYVLKVDDDMFVNMQHITDFSETRTFNKCIIGKLAKKWKPHRNTNNKWYVPPEAFNGTMFPNFATGPAYMLSGDAARPLYETSLKLRPMYLEDVFITGIVAEKAGIKRLNHGMIRNTHIDNIDECTFKRLMTSHKHSPQDIIRLWDLVYRQTGKPCETPKTAKPNSVPAAAPAVANKAPVAQNKVVTPAKPQPPSKPVAAAG